MAIDMETMLAKIKDRQWALADIDWDAPGAETISDEFRPKLKAFMADLCWIENIGARGFAALAKKAPTRTLAEIYRWFTDGFDTADLKDAKALLDELKE